ncbi:MAG TPA: hypothetical protein VHO70_08620, partial [Chitinispirillaceae bacterium]|nr:hypothetical protein [Chitinispirillaceae bacterium]
NGGSNSYNNNHNGQQNQRRRPDRFKRDNYNHNDRLIKQNDIIIRLLKEIRDRLPAPAATEAEYCEEDQRMESQECSSEDQDVQEEVDMEVMEPVNDNYDHEQENEYPEDER